MSVITPETVAAPAPAAVAAPALPAATAGVQPQSPGQRAWARFRRNTLGYVSLWLFAALLLVATLAELVSNDKPFVAHIDGQLWFPVITNPAEVALGGDFATPTDW